MREYLPFLVIGLASGSIYAIAAMGLVVTYKTSGVFNFAHGAVGMIATFIFYSLRVDAGLPTWLAAALGHPRRGAAHRGRDRPGAAPETPGSVGVELRRGLARPAGRPAVPRHRHLRAGHPVGGSDLLPGDVPAARRQRRLRPGDHRGHLAGLGPGAGRLLPGHPAGDPDPGRGRRRRPHRARWGPARPGSRPSPGCWAARSPPWPACCSAPFLGIDAVLLTLLVIKAFGAAAVGRLVSLPLTYVGAIGIGVGESLLTKWVAARPGLAGLPTQPVVHRPLRRAGLLPQGALRRADHPGRPRCRRRPGPADAGPQPAVPVPAPGVVPTVAVLLPAQLDGSRLLTATSTVAFVLVFASLGLLVGLSRQVSLCHAVFVVFGATTLSHFQDGRAFPTCWRCCWPGSCWCRSGALVAIPAIRLSGLFLALATFGFGVLAQYLLFGTKFVFGTKALRTLSPPRVVRHLLQRRQGLLLLRAGRGGGRDRGHRAGPGHPARPDPAGPGRLAHGHRERGGQPHRLPGHRLLPQRLPGRRRRRAARIADPGGEPDELRLLPVAVLDRRPGHGRGRRRWAGPSCRPCSW